MDFTRAVSKLTQDELGKRQDYRPVYSLHKYWARRAGSQFRAILLKLIRGEEGLFIEDEFGGLSTEGAYFQSHDFKDLVVCDPFKGGGTSLIEANRLGASVIGRDLNPLSWWITKEGLKRVDLKKLDRYFKEVIKTAHKELGPLYQTAHTNPDGSTTTANAMYYFWYREATCSECQQKVTLQTRTNLNNGLKRGTKLIPEDPATTVCLDCGALGGWSGEGFYSCEACEAISFPQGGNDVGTGYSKGHFSHCGKEQSVVSSVKKFGRLGERLIAIEYVHPVTEERVYKAPDEEDLGLVELCSEMVEEDGGMLIPDAEVPVGDSSERWRNHDYNSFSDVFFDRQLVAIDAIARAIFQVVPEKERTYRDSLITCLSNSLEYNNSMVPYNYPHRKLHHLFTHHALPVTMMPVENNVLGVDEKKGSGTFHKCYLRYRKAKAYCQNVFDGYKHPERKGIQKAHSDETIEASIVGSFEELRGGKQAFLSQGDSSKLHEDIPPKSVDLVVTDPPYYDSIHYSELANFFYVWLRELLPEVDEFSMPLIDSEREAIVNKKHGKGAKEYEDVMTDVFSSCHKVLKDDGRLAFTFHHRKTEAWWAIVNAIGRSGFGVSETFAVESEYKVNPHIRGKLALDMDLVIICEKAEGGKKGVPRGLEAMMEELPPKAAGVSENPNRMYLDFMGELLLEATALRGNEGASFEWFSEMLGGFNRVFEREVSRMARAKKVIERFSKAITAQFAIVGLGDHRTHRTVQGLFPNSIADSLDMKVPDVKTKAPHKFSDSWKADKSLMFQAKVTEVIHLSKSDNRVTVITSRIERDPKFNKQTSAKTIGEYTIGVWNQRVKGCKEIFDESRMILLLWPKELKDATLEEGTPLEFIYFEHELPEFDSSKMKWKWGKGGKEGGVVWGYLDGENVFRNQKGHQTTLRLKIPDDAIRFSIPYNTTLLDLDTMEFDEGTITYPGE